MIAAAKNSRINTPETARNVPKRYQYICSFIFASSLASFSAAVASPAAPATGTTSLCFFATKPTTINATIATSTHHQLKLNPQNVAERGGGGGGKGGGCPKTSFPFAEPFAGTHFCNSILVFARSF